MICSGASPNGFTAGLGQNGLSVNVQSGATVGNGTTNNITLNDNNAVMNFGSIRDQFSNIHSARGLPVASKCSVIQWRKSWMSADSITGSRSTPERLQRFSAKSPFSSST